jgi:hypothetical protein
MILPPTAGVVHKLKLLCDGCINLGGRTCTLGVDRCGHLVTDELQLNDLLRETIFLGDSHDS